MFGSCHSQGIMKSEETSPPRYKDTKERQPQKHGPPQDPGPRNLLHGTALVWLVEVLSPRTPVVSWCLCGEKSGSKTVKARKLKCSGHLSARASWPSDSHVFKFCGKSPSNLSAHFADCADSSGKYLHIYPQISHIPTFQSDCSQTSYLEPCTSSTPFQFRISKFGFRI